MALKVLMMKKKLDEKREELRQAQEAAATFATREADLEKDIADANTAEERTAVEEEIEKFEAEKAESDAAVADLEAEVTRMEQELADAEAKQETKPAEVDKPQEEDKRKKVNHMEFRSFKAMTFEERTAFCAREDVHTWLDQVRSLGRATRAVSNVEVTIPTVVLPLIRESIEKHSKLLKHVNRRFVKGKTRQNIINKAPEAIWEEMTAAIKELTVAFGTPIECDGYKVAGYVPIANSLLDDSDVNLAAEIIDQIGEAIGYALDKALLCGKGSASKMPTGFATGLASAQLTTITAANSTGTNLFKNIILAAAKADHIRGEIFWCMNHKTKMTLLAESVGVNSAAAIVAGMNAQMPVIGGSIEELDFIPDNMIYGGYGDCYLLVEREGTVIDMSKDVQFIEDNTVYRGKARYDGKPVFADSFVGIGISGTAPSVASITFAGEDEE